MGWNPSAQLLKVARSCAHMAKAPTTDSSLPVSSWCTLLLAPPSHGHLLHFGADEGQRHNEN